MDLTNATIDELITLELAVSIAHERLRLSNNEDLNKRADMLEKWADRIRQAKDDVLYENPYSA